MLSEAKHLSVHLLWKGSIEIDPSFFSRDCGIRMTLMRQLKIIDFTSET
jgi:hypothetical protein